MPQDDDQVIVISSSSDEEGDARAGAEVEEEQPAQPPPPPPAPPPPPPRLSPPAPPPATKRARTTGNNAATTTTARLERARLAQERAAARQEAALAKAADKARKRDAKLAERLAAGRLQTREMVVLLCLGGKSGAASPSSSCCSPSVSACAAALEALDRSTYGIRYAYPPPLPPTTPSSSSLDLLLARTGASLVVRFARRPLTHDTAGVVPAGSSLELPAQELLPSPTGGGGNSWADDNPDDRRRHVPYVLLVYEQPAQFLAQMRRDGGRAMVAEAARAYPHCSLAITVVCPPDGRLFSATTTRTTTTTNPAGNLHWSDDDRRWRELQLLCPAVVQLRSVGSPHDVAAQVVAAAKALAKQPYERLLAVGLPAGGDGDGEEEGLDDDDDEYDDDDDENENANDENAAAAAAAQEEEEEEAPVVEGGRTQNFRACRAVAALGGQALRSSAAALNCVRGVSGARAAAVVERFPSLGALMAAYGVGAEVEDGEDGGGGRRREKAAAAAVPPPPRSRYALTCGLRSINAPEAQGVGDALARKLHYVLTCDDPDELVE
jgi:hypothetical protein